MKSSARQTKNAISGRQPAASRLGELIDFGGKIAQAGFAAGTGGRISLREGNLVWIKPEGFAMGDLTPHALCGVDLDTGKQVQGKNRAPPEMRMHLAIYRARPDVSAVFQARSPWATVAIDSGLELKAMFAEFINDLGRTGTMPFVIPGARAFADAAGAFARTHDTIFMVKRGVLAVGVTMKQAYYRLVVAEDAAKSLLAAVIVGKPKFFTQAQIAEILSLDAVQHRTKMVENKS